MMILKKLKILDLGRYIAFDEYEGIEVAWNQVKLNLVFNQLSQNIPFSFASLKSLRYLNLSHNSLSGSIGDIFTGLKNLKQIQVC
ncbi:protein STRUBBELIG-RECEPTOR FAMILY 2-like [Magnolia sinica]|uniref:protein STRUBBELIG-RECEPTOR FAMILY 2-like n=1 Tax=Magnolia sinica TaxID=86752 RepID=UPI0026592ACF|nr:protein STRUBBELIG-RECEPTOR FAMILY 2-like [Magnolia sinica]